MGCRKIVRWVAGFAILASSFLPDSRSPIGMVQAAAQADPSGDTTYPAYRQSARTCTVWAPLFRYGTGNWTSAIVIHNEGVSATNVEFRMRSMGGGPLLTYTASMAALTTQEFDGGRLGLPDGFRGSLIASASPCGQVSAMTRFLWGDGRGLGFAVPSVEAPGSSLRIPFILNQYNAGWDSTVVVHNPDTRRDVEAVVTYRSDERGPVEQRLRVPAGASVDLDLNAAPIGPLGIDIEADGDVVAGAFVINDRHFGQGFPAIPTVGSQRVFLPVVYKNYNDGASGIFVRNTGQASILPRALLREHDTGRETATLTASAPLAPGGSYTWYLPAEPSVQPGIYSVVVESDGAGSLVAIAQSLRFSCLGTMAYLGFGRTETSYSAPDLVNVPGVVDSRIFVQNTSSGPNSATVQLRDDSGATIATSTVQLRANGATSLRVSGLPELSGSLFTGSAEIKASVPVVVVVEELHPCS